MALSLDFEVCHKDSLLVIVPLSLLAIFQVCFVLYPSNVQSREPMRYF